MFECFLQVEGTIDFGFDNPSYGLGAPILGDM